MIAVIAEVLRDKLSTLPWIERTGGLVLAATRPNLSTAPDMSTVVAGYQTYPVSATVNLQDCWESGAYKLLEPDSLKSAVAFFVDDSGVQSLGTEGPKGSAIRFKFSLKMLCWMNLARLGSMVTGGNVNAAGRAAAYVMAEMLGRHSATGLFGGGVEEDAFLQIEVKDVDELKKSPAMFDPFDFAKRSELFFYPYDYFGLLLRGEFIMPVRCLPDFAGGWAPTDSCFAPGGDVNWFSRAMALYLASLHVYDSNEDAIADGLSEGDPYWASSAHVAGADALMRVV